MTGLIVGFDDDVDGGVDDDVDGGVDGGVDGRGIYIV